MKTAIVLFNLGGPDSLGSVKRFLFNLFYDPAIITLPNPLRFMLAKWIAARRAPVTQEMYRQIGGKSPLLSLTQLQVMALQAKLGMDFRVFVCMRYSAPLSKEVVAEVKRWEPDRVLLLPLYPQYAGATTGSSYRQWQEECKKQNLIAATRLVCCYPTQAHFVDAHIARLRPVYEQALAYGAPRVIFSAHGLPQKMVDGGDPYQWQVEQTVKAVVERLSIPGLDYVISYQSRVGRLEWLKPYTEAVIAQAAREGRPVVVVPIAFVSEHSETLVELDIDYRKLAQQNGCPGYFRVPALGVQEDYIAGLAEACRSSSSQLVCAASGNRICPADRTLCPA